MKRHSAKKTGLQALLKNRNVLYVVFALAIINLFSYLMLKQLDAVAFFIIIGFLTTYFSKNMIIVMLTSVISTFLLVQIKMLGKKEGMGTMRDSEGETGTETGTGGDMTPDDSTSETGTGETGTGTGTGTGETGTGTGETGTGTGTSRTGTSRTGTGGAGTRGTGMGMPNPMSTSEIPISNEMRSAITAISNDTAKSKTKSSSGGTEKFTQKLSPARYDAADDDTTPRHKPKIDYAATLESAYDNLDKLLSSDAIKNMSEDTGRLADKQKQLMDNIGKLTPIMDKASSVLNNLDMGGISGLMGGIQERMKGFGKDPVIPGDK